LWRTKSRGGRDAGFNKYWWGWEEIRKMNAVAQKYIDTARHGSTMRIVVGQAWNPHRIMVNHDGKSQTDWDSGMLMNYAGWTHQMEFWAFPTKRSGTIRIAVGQAWNPHRIMVNHDGKSQAEWDSGMKMDYAGWKHQMEFWVYPSRTEDGNHVWGVNSGDAIYYRAGHSGSWEHIGGGLKQVSVSGDGNHVWGVNSKDEIYYRAGYSGSWERIDGRLKQVSI